MERTPSTDTIWHNTALTAAGPTSISNRKTNGNKTSRKKSLLGSPDPGVLPHPQALLEEQMVLCGRANEQLSS